MTSVSPAALSHLAPPRPGLRLRMSYDEYLAWAPENLRAEWADGEAIVFMPSTDIHQQAVGLLYQLLSLFVATHQLGIVRMGPLEVKLWPGRHVSPTSSLPGKGA